MSWATDIYYIMTNDSSLNNSTAGIYFENLPDNADITEDYIVFTYRKDSETNVFGKKNVNSDYIIDVICISTSPYRLTTLSDMVSNYLNNVNYGGIKEINFQNDNRTKDLDEGVYLNTIEFKAFYND